MGPSYYKMVSDGWKFKIRRTWAEMADSGLYKLPPVDAPIPDGLAPVKNEKAPQSICFGML